jgi:hypothetical protein
MHRDGRIGRDPGRPRGGARGLPALVASFVAVTAAGSGLVASSAQGGPPRASKHADVLVGLSVTSGRQFAGDTTLLATVSPNGDGLRDRAVVRFRLERPAEVALDVIAASKHPKTVWTTSRRLGAGSQRLEWDPASATPPRTYLLRLTVRRGGRVRRIYGSLEGRAGGVDRPPVVRVQGVDAAFRATSYAPGASARLRIATDARTFTVEIFQAGPETRETVGYRMEGVPVGTARHVDWSAHRDSPGTLRVSIGDWPNGIYFARLTADDGRVGYAPFLVRPRRFGVHRVAVVVHTDTWQAYNHQDVDGDGWGDTWYARGATAIVDLRRPFINGGAPPHWRRYDLSFLHWLYRSGKEVDLVGDEDLDRFRNARTLARFYDLLVFEGHEEYVTRHEYDLVTGFRNLGGNLAFLSSTNFLWRVDRHGPRITRVARWRTIGRPEARLAGVQYRANDEGEHRGAYSLTPAGRRSWAFDGVPEDAVAAWRWFGIEVDMTTRLSPPGTVVLARVEPHYRDASALGEMTYYERGSAKVFAAGSLNFTAALWDPSFRRLLENVWAHLASP